MSLQLLLGPAGSGKSTYLYRTLTEKAEHSSAFQAIAIVPEQFTMQTQKDLVSLHSRHSVTNIDILSFERLAYRILGELGAENLTVLDDMGKVLVLRRAAAGCAGELSLYRRNLDKAGFIDKIKSMLSELYQYRIDEKELSRLIEETADEPLLQRKLREIRTLYLAFDESMEADTIPSERLFDVLCRLIPESELIRNSVITFDGFTGFTPAQYRVLETLMQYARAVVVTVTVDADLPDVRPAVGSGEEEISRQIQLRERALLASRRQLFDMSIATAETLCRLAEKNGIEVKQSRVFSPGVRFAKAPSLKVLERQLLRCPAEPSENVPQEIMLWETKDRETELYAVARRIFHLVSEEGMRYRDIAVVSSDIAGYEPVIRRVFDRCGIPCFIDVKNNMMGHPLVAYLRGAIEAVERDYSYETVFACLKSGMASIREIDLYELENYVLAMGIRGRRMWESDWEYVYREGRHIDMAHLNDVRRQAIKPLFALQEALEKEQAAVRDYAAAMVELMQSQAIEERLKTMAGQIAAEGEPSLSLEYQQAYDKVLELLDKVVELFGDGQVSIREWREILDTGFAEIRVGVIPACVDRVVAGDMRRTRLKDPRVLFFVGANDGLVPAAGEKSSLLSDMDRRSLERRGVHLAPTVLENGFIDRFYLYLTLTKPSEQLYVSWCRQDPLGAVMLPSYLVGELQGIFPALVVDRPDEGIGLPDQVMTPQTARTALLEGLSDYVQGQAPAAWKELYSLFLREPDGCKQMKRFLDAAFYTYHEESMGPVVARALYGDCLQGSVTRLEQYAACAYAQFLSFGLELTERRLHRFEATDMGTLFHEVLQRFFAKVYGEGAELSDTVPDEKTRRTLVRQCLEEAVQEGKAEGLGGSARGDYLLKRVERIADRTLWALCEQLSRGDFRPEEVEVEFDGRDSRAMNLILDSDTIMRLYGRIDRVDTCENSDEVYVKVIDYKSGNTSLDLVGVYYGLQLQLVVYLDAAMEREQKRHRGKKIIPAGILYYNIRDPYIAVDPARDEEAKTCDVEEELLKELCMNGIVNRDRRIYSRMDRLVGSDAPPVIPVVEKDGLPVEKRSSVADTKQLQALCRFVRGRMQEFGQRIMEGDLAVNPYTRGGRTGCDYCRFGAVCGFDKKMPGYAYRQLGDIPRADIWSQVEQNEQ